MSLEDIDIGSGETGGTSAEAPSEKSEKQKESSRKAQSELQKTQKDEKKAKHDNDDLFAILARFIKNPLYEDLIPSIVALLQEGYPSRFILVLIALFFPEASHYLFDKLGKQKESESYKNLHHYSEPHTFHDEHLHSSIRSWVTLWMSTSQDYLVDKESSVILHDKTLTLLASDSRKIVERSMTLFFSFFLGSCNVIIDSKKAETYALFIISEYEKTLGSFLETADDDLKKKTHIDANDLFGMA